MNKRSVELSMNFLVMIIISIVVLSFAVTFAKNLFTKAEKIRLEVDQQTNEKIEELLDDGSRVVIPFTRKTINRGKLGVFGVGVLNVVGTNTSFNMNVNLNVAFDKQKNPIEDTEDFVTIILSSETVQIKNNERHKFSFGVDVDKKARSGTYLLDVEIFYYNGSEFVNYGDPAFPIYKVFVTVP